MSQQVSVIFDWLATSRESSTKPFNKKPLDKDYEGFLEPKLFENTFSDDTTAAAFLHTEKCACSLQSAIGSLGETGGRRCRLPQGFPAAALRLSLVSLSADAARQPSAFIAHLAHTRSCIYGVGAECKHRGTCLNRGYNKQPCVCQPAKQIKSKLFNHLKI